MQSRELPQVTTFSDMQEQVWFYEWGLIRVISASSHSVSLESDYLRFAPEDHLGKCHKADYLLNQPLLTEAYSSIEKLAHERGFGRLVCIKLKENNWYLSDWIESRQQAAALTERGIDRVSQYGVFAVKLQELAEKYDISPLIKVSPSFDPVGATIKIRKSDCQRESVANFIKELSTCTDCGWRAEEKPSPDGNTVWWLERSVW